MANPRYAEARSAIKDFRRASRKDLMGDYKFTTNQLDAIFGNLQTSAKGSVRGLTSYQARELAALRRLNEKVAARTSARVEQAQERAVTNYGTAMGPAIRTALAPARAAAQGSAAITQAGLGAGRLAAQGGQTALGIQTAAAREAAAGAEYATAVALKSRGMEDAAAAAQMQFELQKMRLDNRYAMQQMERQYELQYEYDKKARDELAAEQESLALPGLVNSANLAADAYVQLQQIFNQPVIQDPTTGEMRVPNSPGEAAAYYLQQYPSADPNAQYFITQLATNMYAAGAGGLARGEQSSAGWLGEGGLYGPGASDAERQQLIQDSVSETILSVWPQYADAAEKVKAAVAARALTVSTRAAIESASGQEAGEDKSWIEGVVDFGAKYALPVAGIVASIATANPAWAAGAFAISAAYDVAEEPGTQGFGEIATAGVMGGVKGYIFGQVGTAVTGGLAKLSSSKIGALSKTGGFFESIKLIPQQVKAGGLGAVFVPEKAAAAASAARAAAAKTYGFTGPSAVVEMAAATNAGAAPQVLALTAGKTVAPSIAQALGTTVDDIVALAAKVGVTPEYLGRLALQAKNGSQKATDILVALLSSA